MKNVKQNELKIIFLDVDGVLNCSTTLDRVDHDIGIEDGKVSLLKRIVDDTGAVIVLVSSWKYFWSSGPKDIVKENKYGDYLVNKLSKQGLTIYSKTEDGNSFYRGMGIIKYLYYLYDNDIPYSQFVILDNNVFDYRETDLLDNLVCTNYKYGLTQNLVDKAIKILNDKNIKKRRLKQCRSSKKKML